jgi:hypothetical protein
MTADDLEAFGRVMVLINETYGDPNRAVSDVKLSFYFHVLGDLTIEEIGEAVFNMARTKTCHTFPTPGEIREALPGKAKGCAEKAFTDLIDAIRRVGVYRIPLFEDEVLIATIRALGGWEAVCGWRAEDRHWKRREFLSVYQACGAGEGKGDRRGLLRTPGPDIALARSGADPRASFASKRQPHLEPVMETGPDRPYNQS